MDRKAVSLCRVSRQKRAKQAKFLCCEVIGHCLRDTQSAGLAHSTLTRDQQSLLSRGLISYSQSFAGQITLGTMFLFTDLICLGEISLLKKCYDRLMSLDYFVCDSANLIRNTSQYHFSGMQFLKVVNECCREAKLSHAQALVR